MLWIPKGYCVVKKLVWNVRIKAFWYKKSYVDFLQNDNNYLSDLFKKDNINKNNIFLCYIYSYNIVVILPIKYLEIYIFICLTTYILYGRLSIPTKHLCILVPELFLAPYLHKCSAVVQIMLFLLIVWTNLHYIGANLTSKWEKIGQKCCTLMLFTEQHQHQSIENEPYYCPINSFLVQIMCWFNLHFSWVSTYLSM